MFDTEEFQEFETGHYIEPGVREVEIVGFEAVNDEEKPYINVSVKLIGEEDNNALTKRFYMNKKSEPYSGGKIKSMLKACLPPEETKITAENLDEFTDKLNEKLQGKQYRQLFTAREYESNGRIRVSTEFPIAAKSDVNGQEVSAIVESLEEGNVYPKVDETNLVYDKDDPKHYNKLDKLPTPEGTEDKAWE